SDVYFLFSAVIRAYLFFFFDCHGDHRDPRSFPTRRSSDLKSLDRDLFVDQATGYVSCREAEAKSSDAHLVGKVRLADSLPELAERWGAEVTFMHGEDERTLIDKFGGMGALLRW